MYVRGREEVGVGGRGRDSDVSQVGLVAAWELIVLIGVDSVSCLVFCVSGCACLCVVCFRGCMLLASLSLPLSLPRAVSVCLCLCLCLCETETETFKGWPGRLSHLYVSVWNLPGQPLKDLFKACTLVCVPSRYEPFGITVLEAWACQKPVVVTHQGGPGE